MFSSQEKCLVSFPADLNVDIAKFTHAIDYNGYLVAS